MQSEIKIPIDQEKIKAFCQKWKIIEFSLFGSVLREDFRPDSDVDVLVTFAEDADWGLFDIVHMEDELKIIFGREVDLSERPAVMKSKNPIRKESILSTARVFYAA